MTTDTAPAIKFGDDWATPTAFLFEGCDIVIHFHPDVGSMARLDDLCEIHQCGAPEDVLPMLQQSGDGYHDPCQLADFAENPGASLVNLDDIDLMGTIRALSTDWNLAVRFRGWLIERVFQSSPHLERDEERAAFWREAGSRFKSTHELRDFYWKKELQRHHAAQAPTPVKADVLNEIPALDLYCRLGNLLREVQEQGQCSREEAAAVIVATVQALRKDRSAFHPTARTQPPGTSLH